MRVAGYGVIVLTWMHLSDLHVSGEGWQRDDVLEALVRDLPELLSERALQPDLLLVCGDVASHGRREEYDDAFAVLEQITAALGLERREHVFMVPGNHDVDRSRVGGMAALHHQALVQLGPEALSETLGELLGQPAELGLYGERLREWCAFTERFLGPARAVTPTRPWRADVVVVRGLPVGVLSLCTAWASGSDREHGRLLLGERQLRDALAQARAAGARVVMALMHHPLSWLHPEEHSAIRGRLEREVDVLLHGHTHEAHSAVQTSAGSTHATLGAGAAYAGLGQDRYHGFSIGRLDVVGGGLEVHHFTWSTRSAKWHLDTGAPGVDEKGRVVVRLAAGPANAGPELGLLATRLRAAAASVYATVDFAGLGVAGPRKHVTLDQVFVPLELEPASPRACTLPPREPAPLVASLPGAPVPEHAEPSQAASGPRRRGLEELQAQLLLPAEPPAGVRMLVLGEAGSGKSMLCRHLATAAALADGGPVPLLLTVRDWVGFGRHEQLLELAARHATEVLSVRTGTEDLEALCEQGRALLLVDGLDEAGDPALRRELRDRIHGFVASRPHVPIVVTSRAAGYHEVALNEGFAQLGLAPFDEPGLTRFVQRWYDLVECNADERERKRDDLLRSLAADPATRALAYEPLVATLVSMLHTAGLRLPEGRPRLYDAIIELLVVTWPAERRRELTELPGTVQLPLLEALARGFEPEPLVDTARLEERLAELLRSRFATRDVHELRHLARRWSKWLVVDSGLLHEPRPGRVGFRHRALMERLAARSDHGGASAPLGPSTPPAPHPA